MEFLNGCRAGQVHFKDCLTVNLDIYCFNLTAAFSNKKKTRELGGSSEITEIIKMIDLFTWTLNFSWKLKSLKQFLKFI